ncbi:IS5 family transposase [Streptomyces sp. NPDC048751]|uniref:IS5 family transposase n=1 Tax=Streptomyces sp. NPDC048751 TaxID=3365591 RepID=UPI00370F92C4
MGSGVGRLRPFLPVSNGRCGRWRDRRQVIDGILHRVRTGVQWRDLPERFGPWKTVYERHRLWSADGTWERLLQQVQAAADAAGEVDRDISVDSTIVSEGLGRSRGGFTSKLHLSADGRCRPLSLVLTGGQRADCTQFKAVLEKIRVPRTRRGRPRTKPDSLAADKGYSNRPCRTYLRRRGIRLIIPEQEDRQPGRTPAQRLTRRTATRLRRRAYKKRNTVERAINRLKQSRAVATRYDKRGFVFLGTATAAALVIWLRT